MIEQIPLALVLYDAVMGGPTNDGFQNHTLIGERSIGVVADGVAKEVAVAGGVREIVLTIVLVHPRCLEEAMRVASLQGLSVLVEDNNGTWSLGKLQHIVAHAHYAAVDGRGIGLGKELRLVIGSGAEVDETIVIAVLAGDRSQSARQRAPPLQLSAPESAEVAVDLSVVVLEHTGIDGERAANGMFLRNERTFGLVGNGYTEVEHAVVAFRGEDEIVLAVLLDDVVIPHLLLCPGHLVDIENHTMIGGLVVLDVVPRQHVVVAHLEMSAVVVETFAGIPVVAGIYIEPSVEHVGRRISHIIAREQITR